MSFPYPQDRTRDRQEKGAQPYQDAKEAMSQSESVLQTEAEEWGETHQREPDEDRTARVEAEMEERLRDVNREVGDDARAGS